MALINPPFAGVPDEHAHYWKSWSIALGQINCGSGNEIPASAHELPGVFPPAVQISGGATRYVFGATAEKLFEKDTDALAVGVKAACAAPPLGFLPQAFGLRVGKMLRFSALGDLFLARICNLLVSALLVSLAIRIIPFGKIVLLVVGLLPMTIQQFSSLSYDALHISSCLLFIAYVVKLSSNPQERLRPGEMTLLLALGLVALNIKLGYVGLAFLVFMLPASKFPTPTRSWLFSTAYVGVNVLFFSAVYQIYSGGGFTWGGVFERLGYLGLAVAVALLAASANEQIRRHWRLSAGIFFVGALVAYAVALRYLGTDGGVAGPAGVDPSRQLARVLHAPLQFLNLILEAVYNRFTFYLETFLYKPGWLFRSLHPAWYVFLLAGLAVILRNENESVDLTRRQRLIILAVFVFNAFVIFLSQYIGWTKVGGQAIEGVQGRYLLCIAPLLILFFYKSDFTFRLASLGKHMPALLLAFYLALFGGVYLSIYVIYYDKEPDKPIVTKIQTKLFGHR